ncbi:MAG: molybdate ABC transporter substrate-binding protein [Oscillospiraceae bacterium]|nr:molybdate ABC transporter substrate-binding protein [Oscillospiraceae bacterium]
MKKILSLLCAAGMALSLAACGSSGTTTSVPPSESLPATTETATTEPITLEVFAAASLTSSMEQIKAMYKDVNPNVTINYTFGSSGTLVTQIKEGSNADIFFSAGEKEMNELDSTNTTDNTTGADFVLQGTRIDLLSNTVVLVVPEGNPAGITSFEDLGTDKLTLLAVGNANVPVGRYAEQALTSMGLWDQLVNDSKLTYGSDVKEVTSFVSEGAVDAGIVYLTDATDAGLTVVAEAPADSHEAVIYPAAVLNITQNETAAKEFLDYLSSDEATAIFTAAGFSKAA